MLLNGSVLAVSAIRRVNQQIEDLFLSLLLVTNLICLCNKNKYFFLIYLYERHTHIKKVRREDGREGERKERRVGGREGGREGEAERLFIYWFILQMTLNGYEWEDSV